MRAHDDKPIFDNTEPTDKKRYCHMVGGLLYALVATRPDISETINRLCKVMAAPTMLDMRKAVRCLLYLKGTSHLTLA